MKILFVHSGNHECVAPFILEQAASLHEAGCDVKMFAVEGHGILGYLRCLPKIKKLISDFKPDILHAHYGLCGLLCTLQHKIPVVVTYHGSDINNRTVRILSKIAIQHADFNIFVSQKLKQRALTHFNNNALTHSSTVLPCGVDTSIFHPMNREDAIKRLELNPTAPATRAIKQSNNKAIKLVLFAGAFDNEVKNYQLAKEVCSLIPEVTLLELKGYSRTEVAALMNVADALLMTSHSEGSPQVVKEALACGLPIVSVDVGDVAEITANAENCHIVKENTAKCLSDTINHVLTTSQQVKVDISRFDNKEIVKQLIQIYNTLTVASINCP